MPPAHPGAMCELPGKQPRVDEENLLIPNKDHARRERIGLVTQGGVGNLCLESKHWNMTIPIADLSTETWQAGALAGREGLGMNRSVIPGDGGCGTFQDSICSGSFVFLTPMVQTTPEVLCLTKHLAGKALRFQQKS